MAEEGSELEKRKTGEEFSVDAAGAEMAEERPEETEEIREQIVETRKEMGETIDAIQDRLSLSNISEQVSEKVSEAVDAAKGAAYDATFGKAVTFMKSAGQELSKTDLLKTVQRNPLPLVLIGAGVGLLVYKAVTDSKAHNRDYSTGGREYKGSERTRRGDSAAEATGGKLSSVGDTVAKGAASAYDSAAEKAESAYSAVGDAARQAYDKVGGAGNAARQQYDRQIKENPLAVGAVALALGAAVGFTIPSTRYESDLMGDAKQNLFEKAKTGASDLIDKSKEVAQEAGRAAGEQAKAAIADAAS
ncbi:MAG: DUF3618 domain-containing protein [Pyrinomonadaceae bacterium]